MPRNRKFCPDKKPLAFTLIEMLVVIAIIGILAAMLMPGLRKALKASQSISCANRLRQVGIAQSTYASSYNGIVVLRYTAGTSPIRWPCFLMGTTNSAYPIDESIIDDPTVLVCPTWKYLAGSATNVSPLHTYGGEYDTSFFPNRLSGINGTFVRLTNIKSNRVLIGDSVCNYNSYTGWIQLSFVKAGSWFAAQFQTRHLNRMNGLFRDCSVRNLDYPELIDCDFTTIYDENCEVVNF